MSSSGTIARNVLFSYGRTFVAAALTLFSSRWILMSLGASDYGIYGLVGGLLVIVSLISGVLSQGANRYIAFAIGQGNAQGVCKWFNVTANIYWTLPVVLSPVGLIVGELIVTHLLKIPTERLPAALWIVRFSVISVTASFASMPYQALLIARQYIHLTSMISLCGSIGMFIIALLLPLVPYDRLIAYAALVTISVVLMNLTYVVICRLKCSEGRVDLSYWWDTKSLCELSGFSGWMLLGSAGMFLRDQGLNFLVNWSRGTVANAGRAIGNQLGYQTETMYNAFASALSPELARREGAGTRQSMLFIAKCSQRLGIVIMLLVGLPLFCECEYVLKLWLKTPPQYAVFFTRIQILAAIICRMRIGHMMCFQAIGKAKPQQLVDFSFYILTILVVGSGYCLTHSLEGAFAGYVVAQVFYVGCYVAVGSHYFEWTLGELIKGITIPASAIFTSGLLISAGVTCMMPMSFLRLIVNGALLELFILSMSWWFVFNSDDRTVMKEAWRRFKSRMRCTCR